MDKKILKSVFTKESIHRYTCPYCYKGELRLEGDFNSKETVASKAEHREEYWEPEFIRLIFSCTLKCSSCSESVFVVGDGSVEEEYFEGPDGDWDRGYVEFYRPSFFHPTLQLIDFPAESPAEVVSALRTAFSSYFSSPSTCCNSLRAAAEEILTTLGVPVHPESGEGYLSFGRRIQMLGDDNQSVRALFDAIRWLGNYGSHPGIQVEFDDALNALEIMELLLEEVYSDRKRKIQDLAEAINSSRGPISRLPRTGSV
ncbi:DUF4145 domain-containing protein [Stutzerimonas stutzeri]|uniref:DUF4145 domain-containing protein n=1 Tax=Stutzerimonas stutzeri TaxID=316 RepID=UPI0009B811AF|nr:DUF4145 domain-containing protein [Stutzerimonas stutzeri]MCQ4331043.1 DUF4145 domain-containing protein [Stutzerimonas stutzeri]